MEESKQADEVRTVEGVMACPFCGGKSDISAEGWLFWGRCRECGAEGKPCDDEPCARAAWNRRATQAQQVEPPDSYVRNCKIIGTRGETLFHGVNDSVYASLDGYTIMTNERYYALTHGYATPSAPARQAVRMLTEDERDARRYRWWREWAMGDEDGALLDEFLSCDTPEDVDAFIDKVLSALPLEQQEGGK